MSLPAAPKPLRYSGAIKIGHYAQDGTFLGFTDPVNFVDFSLNPDGDVIIQTDNGITYFGEAKTVNYQKKPTKLSLEVDELNGDLLADTLRGFFSAFSQSAATAQPFTVTLVKDKWVDVGTMNIGNVAIGTKVLGTDYKVDPVLGQIMALTTDTAGSQTGTFDQGAITGDKIISGNTGPIILAFAGQVKDHNSGNVGAIRVPKVHIDAKTALQIIGAKGNQQIKFDGLLLVPGDGSPIFAFYADLAMAPLS